MTVSGADRQRAYLGRQRDELLALRREVAELRKRNAALEEALRAAREVRAQPARSPRDLGQFLWPSPRRK